MSLNNIQCFFYTFVMFSLSACFSLKAVVATEPSTQEALNHNTLTIPTKAPSVWCSNTLEQAQGLPNDDTAKNSNIVYLGSAFDGSSIQDQIWSISMSNGSEKLLLNDIPTPFLGLAFLPDKYHYILAGSSSTMQSDLDGSILENVNDVDRLITDFQPYSPIWNILSASPEAADAQAGILHSPNGIYSATWKSGDSALVIVDKKTGQRNEIIQTKIPDSIQGGNWSPDGNRFAFTLYKNSETFYSQLFIVEGDGINLKSLLPIFELEVLTRPIWSPDGQMIAVPFLGKDGWYHIAIINHASGSIQNYKVSPIIRMNSIQNQGELVWSPNSKWIAYISQYEHFGIELLNIESGEIYCGSDNKKLAINMLDWR